MKETGASTFEYSQPYIEIKFSLLWHYTPHNRRIFLITF